MRSGKRSSWKAYLLVLVICTSVGCSLEESINSYVLNRPALIEQNPIHQKKYANPPLEWFKLNKLLDMAAYRGAPEQYGNLILRGRGERKGMSPVVFPHSIHRVNYTCRVCHLELGFSLQKGETEITREDYLNGRFCGACHNGQIAFSVTQACDLCHVNENNGSTSSSTVLHKVLMSKLPKADYGDQINWVKAVETGAIKPKNTLYTEQTIKMMPLPNHLERSLRWQTNKSSVLVDFPHKAHTVWLDCANCHPDIFEINNMGTVAFDKEKNLYGLYCGACHMTVAFPMNGCSRCHPGHKDYSLDNESRSKMQF